MAAADGFSSLGVGLASPASHAEAVTPSDTVEMTAVSRYLHIGASGDVALVMQDGSTCTLTVAANTWLPLRVKRVAATATTATKITAFS